MSDAVDLSKPLYDQNTYSGRAMHFFRVTNPLNLLATDSELREAKMIVDTYKKSKKLPEGYDTDQLWAKKYLVDSAFHPDTGEKMMLIGRMSAQVPMNTLLCGGLTTFYNTTAGAVFWQWLNQTFNATVNFTNRSGDAPINKSRLVTSYLGAVTGAVGTALYLNNKASKMTNPLFARLVPFAAVAAANFINIPLMRSQEMSHGTPVFTAAGERIGESRTAARRGVFLVCISRVIMAIPGMTIAPIVTNYGIKQGWFCRYPGLLLPFQMGLVAFCVTFATPLACAIFKQQASLSVDSLESDLAEIAKKLNAEKVYYNKGL